MSKLTTRDIVDSMDYSGGIDYNKMLPPEDERWVLEWQAATDKIREQLGQKDAEIAELRDTIDHERMMNADKEAEISRLHDELLTHSEIANEQRNIIDKMHSDFRKQISTLQKEVDRLSRFETERVLRIKADHNLALRAVLEKFMEHNGCNEIFCTRFPFFKPCKVYIKQEIEGMMK